MKSPKHLLAITDNVYHEWIKTYHIDIKSKRQKIVYAKMIVLL